MERGNRSALENCCAVPTSARTDSLLSHMIQARPAQIQYVTHSHLFVQYTNVTQIKLKLGFIGSKQGFSNFRETYFS